VRCTMRLSGAFRRTSSPSSAMADPTL
jgi:hypothetical protein